jgi:hypothetical protein
MKSFIDCLELLVVTLVIFFVLYGISLSIPKIVIDFIGR